MDNDLDSKRLSIEDIKNVRGTSATEMYNIKVFRTLANTSIQAINMLEKTEKIIEDMAPDIETNIKNISSSIELSKKRLNEWKSLLAKVSENGSLEDKWKRLVKMIINNQRSLFKEFCGLRNVMGEMILYGEVKNSCRGYCDFDLVQLSKKNGMEYIPKGALQINEGKIKKYDLYSNSERGEIVLEEVDLTSELIDTIIQKAIDVEEFYLQTLNEEMFYLKDWNN